MYWLLHRGGSWRVIPSGAACGELMCPSRNVAVTPCAYHTALPDADFVGPLPGRTSCRRDIPIHHIGGRIRVIPGTSATCQPSNSIKQGALRRQRVGGWMWWWGGMYHGLTRSCRGCRASWCISLRWWLESLGGQFPQTTEHESTKITS